MPQVKRTKGAYIIPFKGAILEIDKTAEIVLNGTIHFGINHLKGSKAETYIRLAENSKWICKEDVLLFFGTFIDVHQDGVFFYDTYGKYISWTGWLAGTEYAVPANASYARVVLRYLDNRTIGRSELTGASI